MSRDVTMVEFAARTVVLGSADPQSSAHPEHQVELDGYLLGDRCVSAAGFCDFLRDAPADLDHTMIDCIDPCFIVHRADGFRLRPRCADYPMIQISFWAAAGYCNWLSRTEGLRPAYDLRARSCEQDRDGYRLPTEAEWEAACRQGFPDVRTGDLDVNSADAGPACRALRAGATLAGNFMPDAGAPVPVGSLPADAAGLYEMLGNLREWCEDRYAGYPAEPGRNPRGAARGAFRVVRGGSFIDPAVALGPAARLAAYEDTKCEVYGFRVARSC